MIPWIIMAVVAVPLVVIAFVASRRRTIAGEHPANEDDRARALTAACRALRVAEAIHQLALP